MILTLILLASLQLVVRASDMSSLFPHPAPIDELSSSTLLARLGKIHWTDRIQPTVMVVEQLYRAQNKDSTTVLGALTVAKLIEQNHINTEGCSKEALKARTAIVKNVKNPKHQSGLTYALRCYLVDTLLRAARYCVVHKDEVSPTVNQMDWLKNLETAMGYDGFDSVPKEDKWTQSREKNHARQVAFHRWLLNVEEFIENDKL